MGQEFHVSDLRLEIDHRFYLNRQFFLIQLQFFFSQNAKKLRFFKIKIQIVSTTICYHNNCVFA